MATILVVEDRPLNRKFLATLLKTAGHDVLEAGDGVEGLSVAERMRPDLVISDILMPTIDGYQLVRRMREIPTLARTPVLFYTASYHEGEARALAEQCGVSDILTKPSDINEILAKIQSVLELGKSPAPPPPDPARGTISKWSVPPSHRGPKPSRRASIAWPPWSRSPARSPASAIQTHS
jgi:CheY-like chemotaxis protein